MPAGRSLYVLRFVKAAARGGVCFGRIIEWFCVLFVSIWKLRGYGVCEVFVNFLFCCQACFWHVKDGVLAYGMRLFVL